jgi:chromosome segregation ATPase
MSKEFYTTIGWMILQLQENKVTDKTLIEVQKTMITHLEEEKQKMQKELEDFKTQQQKNNKEILRLTGDFRAAEEAKNIYKRERDDLEKEKNDLFNKNKAMETRLTNETENRKKLRSSYTRINSVVTQHQLLSQNEEVNNALVDLQNAIKF